MTTRRSRAQALVEAGAVLPLLVLLAVGTVGVGRVVYTRIGLSAVAREAARAATLAPLPPRGSQRNAEQVGEDRGKDVASGFGLGRAVIDVDAPGFDRGSLITVEASYVVTERDLPLLGWQNITIKTRHIEQVDRYRGRGL